MANLLGFQINPFQIADTLQLTDVINNVCAGTRWMQTPRFEPTPAWKHALEHEDCANHLLAVVKVDRRLVGWCRLFPVELQPGVMELGIGVLRAYRRQGIGTMLVKYGLEWGSGRGVAKIVLTTHEENCPAVGLFEKCGFVEKSRENSNLRMELTLSLNFVNPTEKKSPDCFS